MQGVGLAWRLWSAILFARVQVDARTIVLVPPVPGALQAAVDAAAASATAATTTLSLAPGIHSLDHTLSLNGSHAGLVITGGAAAAADARAQGDVPDSAVISGGVAIDQGWSLSLVQAPMVMEVEPEAGRGSATTPPAPVHIWRTPLNEARYPLKVRAGSFRTVRYGAELAIPARYPDADLPGAQPYLGGKFLFVENVTSLAYHPNINGLLVNFTLPKTDLPSGWEQWDWSRVEMMVWPGESWINMRSPVQLLRAPSAADGASAHFQAQCRWCGALNKNAADGIRPNSRFYFFGSADFITAAGEWAVAGPDAAPELLFATDTTPATATAPSALPGPAPSSAPPADVYVAALLSPLVTMHDGADNIVVSNVSITDADYSAIGNQANFNGDFKAHGAPADGAVLISNSSNVTVASTTFYALGGGGVLLANRSAGCLIATSRFVGIGQSGVMFVGNGTTQPFRCRVANNTMLRVGSILHSAAGIFVTTASEIEIHGNTVDTAPRWGIAVRSNQNAASANVHVEWNVVRNTMLATKDGGAISFVDHTATHAVGGGRIANNCVRGVLGVDTVGDGNPVPPRSHSAYNGRLRVGWCSYGIYLDDHTSHVEVRGNVLVQTGGPSLVVHGGTNNTVANNVFANASNPRGLDRVIAKVRRDQWGMVYIDASFGPTVIDANSTGNAVRQNIFLYAAAAGRSGGGGGVGLRGGTGSNVTIIGSAVPLAPHIVGKELSGGVRSNLYYNLANGNGLPLFSDSVPQFSNYTFAEWQQLGFDVDGSSYQGKDPLFVDARTGGAAAGDWRLRPGSPAATLIGFQPPGIYAC